MNSVTSPDAVDSEFAQKLRLVVRTLAIWGLGIAVLILARDFFLMMFAAVLFAVFLGEGAQWIQKLTGLSRKWSLSILVLILFGLLATGLWIGGQMLVDQSREAINSLKGNLDQWQAQLKERGIPINFNQVGPQMANGKSLGFATAFFSSTFGFVTNVFFILVVGIFLAASPQVYRKGVASFWPESMRSGIETLLKQSGQALRHWLLGQLVAMTIIGIAVGTSLALLGVPAAFALGLFAGAISFIPTIGAIMAIVPALMLSAQQGPGTMLAVLAIYGVTQFFESNIATPLIQNQQVNLTAASTLGGQLLAGILFGFTGVALVTPLLAVVQLWLRKLYWPARDQNLPVREYVAHALRNPECLTDSSQD